MKPLDDHGILTPVSYPEWVTPVVVTKCANSSTTFCDDVSTDPKAALVGDFYHLPTTKNI